MQLTNWPDRAAPADPGSLVQLVQLTRALQAAAPARAPLLVHCSAGVGRTGIHHHPDTVI